jgi:hypothetical protein
MPNAAQVAPHASHLAWATMVPAKTARLLARCNGFRVKAGDQVVGAVATPVFSGGSLLPDYLLVRVEAAVPGIFRAVPPDLVAAADAAAETIVLDIDASEIASLPVPDLPNHLSPSAPSPIGGARHAPADYRALVRHRLATPLTVIRGSALTAKERPCRTWRC